MWAFCSTLHSVLSHFTLLCFIVVQSPWVYHRFFAPFPFLFLFLLPSERPPIGFGGGRRLCGIIMGSSWENCPWKGPSEEKKERKIWSCFRSVLETFIRVLPLFGGERSQAREKKMLFLHLILISFNIDEQHFGVSSCNSGITQWLWKVLFQVVIWLHFW